MGVKIVSLGFVELLVLFLQKWGRFPVERGRQSACCALGENAAFRRCVHSDARCSGFVGTNDAPLLKSAVLMIGQVLCRYWIHQRMLPTASSPIHERIRLNQFQCSAIYFLHLCLSWHVTSIFASVPKTNVVPVGLNWYYPQLPPQAADHEFFCHMLHPCCKITFQMSLLIYLYSEFNSYENLLCHQIVNLMRCSLTTG